jgi:hypothetical protein
MTTLINRTPSTSNFTILNNAIANDESLSSTATSILVYLISKPPHWRFNANDIKRRFNIGLNKVYKCMRELIQAGYAVYKRTQSKVDWFIYDTKQIITNPSKAATPPEKSNRVNFEHIHFEHEYKEIKEQKVIEQQPAFVEPSITKQDVVVVSCESNEKLIFPNQLTQVQRKACKAIIKKAPQNIQQDLLFSLAYAIANKTINSVPGYLNQLVTAAKNGTFTPLTAAGSIGSSSKLLIPIWQGFKQSTPTDPEKAKSFLHQAKLALKGA